MAVTTRPDRATAIRNAAGRYAIVPASRRPPEGLVEPAISGGARPCGVRHAVVAAVDAAAAVAAVAISGGAAFAAVVLGAALSAADLLGRRSVQRLTLSAVDDVPALVLRGFFLGGLAAVFGLPISGDRMPGAQQGVAWLGTAAIFVATAAVNRGIVYAVFRRLHARGRLTLPVLIVGAGEVGRSIAERLHKHPEEGLALVGFVDDPRMTRPSVPVLGRVADLPRLIAEHHIHHVFVAFSEMADAELVDLLRACDRADCEIFVVPRLYELGVSAATSGDTLWGLPMVRLRREVFRMQWWTVKRIFDFCLAALALVLAAPLMAVIAVALRFEVGPRVIFRQTRVSRNGRPFELLKFRTLRAEPPGQQSEFCEITPDRIGPVGRFLRRSSLDELPQLWNVLRGQMSLVGPRPEQCHYAEQFAATYPRYRERLRVPAGVTGLAQVHDLRGATPIEDRVCLDNYYIEHWSLWHDIKIMIRTVASVVRLRGR
jgi:exopolysaccharide biosynthesis polyprenyl glycosylphosphotransferase